MNEQVISGSAWGRQWACASTSELSGSNDTKLKFYEYKYIRHILMSMLEFMEKNQGKEGLPFFIYELDPKYVKMLIDKMTARMEEFEPYISKHTTAHTGYWDV